MNILESLKGGRLRRWTVLVSAMVVAVILGVGSAYEKQSV